MVKWVRVLVSYMSLGISVLFGFIRSLLLGSQVYLEFIVLPMPFVSPVGGDNHAGL